MQESNKSKQKSVVPGDGTQVSKNAHSDANWFKAAQEPQEEFMQQGNMDQVEKVEPGAPGQGPQSEGKPTLGGK